MNAPRWDRSGCMEQVCYCHDETAPPYPCSGCGCRPLAGAVAMVAWIAMANPTNEERANMIDKLPTKTTHSTGVNWK